MYGDEKAWVLTTGCFNGLHPNHVQLFHWGSLQGPLIVGINGDTYNQKKNGDRAIPIKDRIYLLKSCKYVTDVMVFEENEPSELILKVRPRYYLKGPDYQSMILPEQAALDCVGAVLMFRPGNYQYSSSKLKLGLEKELPEVEFQYI